MKFIPALTTSLLLATTLSAQNWVQRSSTKGELPAPGKSNQQTACITADLDNDGTAEIIVACRQAAPALVAYLWKGDQPEKIVLEPELLAIEAGGAAHDIDQDGDLDLVFGGDWQSKEVWWWENPFPQKADRWKRHLIKSDGVNQHHDQVFGDFKQTGRAQLVFWNQGKKTVNIADIPTDPKKDNWPYKAIFTVEAGEKNAWYPEGCAAADVDGDGYLDAIAGNYWFKYKGKDEFMPVQFGTDGGRVAAGKFKPSRMNQIVVSPGDGKGRLMLYECKGNPLETKDWKGTDLLGREVIHGHTLEVADLNADGHLDIFCAEMTQWTEKGPVDNPKAEAIFLYGDGMGGFTKKIFQTGMDFHEARLSDVDADGDLDIVSKPYTRQTPRMDVWLQNGSGPKLPNVGAHFHDRHELGLQLYSLRDYFAKDVPGTFDVIQNLGIHAVEAAGLYGLSPTDFRKQLDQHQLSAKSALFDLDLLYQNTDSVIQICKALGTDLVGCAWIPHEWSKFSLTDAERATQKFNEIGKRAAAQGLKFIYHPHGYEFRPIDDGAVTLYDYMMARTDPAYVFYEIDVFWAWHGGVDPVSLLNRYKGRVLALHLKDMAWGQETGIYTGGAPLTSDVAIGTGQIDFHALLRTAYLNGVHYLFLEDENADVKAHLPLSLEYLKGIKH